ncbi:MAG: CARDB domain-containing protein [Acidobacteriota bacterium]
MKNKFLLIAFFSIFLAASFSCQKQTEEEQVPELPDLFVENVSCMGGNLYISIGNQGGPIPEDWTALISLYIDGTSQEDILLTEPTSVSEGGIAESGGSSHYLMAFDITQPLRVDIYVDYTNEIEESNESNNEIENEYIGPCHLPDLKVEDIYLDENCKVMVAVKNVGPGEVPSQVWSIRDIPECTLKLYLNEEEWCQRSFIDFDPDKALSPVEGEAVFPSDLEVAEESTVTAMIDCTDLIKEQNEENNTKSKVLNCR